MEKIVINGGKPLFGRVAVSGSKNAALPLIYAALALRGVSYINNLPDIEDVRVSLRILEGFGVKIKKSPGAVTVDSRDAEYRPPSEELVSELRASSYLLGACLAAFGRARVQSFGGCNFDKRPIDMHLSAISALGAEIDGEDIKADALVGADIKFHKISVGATVNALIMAAAARGETNIYNPAIEPHIRALAGFLRGAGAAIDIYPGRIRVVGGLRSGSRATVIPDMIEAGTYLAAGLATGGEVTVFGVEPTHLVAFTDAIGRAGARVRISSNSITASAEALGRIGITTAPHPGFATDLQPQMAALMAARSGGEITEGVWQSRFGYLSEFQKFGVCSSLCGATAKIEGGAIFPATAVAGDLRAGAAEVILALCAPGESIIENARHIRRGYMNMADKLRALGARIEYK